MRQLGKVKALPILQAYSTLDEIYTHLPTLDPKLQRLFDSTPREHVELCLKVATLVTDAPIEEYTGDLSPAITVTAAPVAALNVHILAHRDHLVADTANQKLFVRLTLTPTAAARDARPDLSVAFLLDTSASMSDDVTDGDDDADQEPKTKMDLVIEAMQTIIADPGLTTRDRFALIRFDEEPVILTTFTPAQNHEVLSEAIDALDSEGPSTFMGAGMREATDLLLTEHGSRRLILLTDGQTVDEDDVNEETERLAQANIPVTTVGVGDDVNTDLLVHITDRTQGLPIDIVPDTHHPYPPAIRASELPAALLEELRRAANEVVTDVSLTARLVRDVQLERITRVHPTQTEVDCTRIPLALGNVDATHGATYLLEFTLPARPAARMRIAQLSCTYRVPGLRVSEQTSPMDIIVTYTPDQALSARVAPDVMQWVQQRNLEQLIASATRQASTDPAQAQRTLQLARNMTQHLNNGVMTVAVDRALQELHRTQSLSAGTSKTLRLGTKTQTIHAQDPDLPTEEEIRHHTGL
ncbi:VWA domain-containing protein [Deinococcus malanensis]|uniref:VWA domain-containing protein n=1 Tax=Deinococcus malanensis TaxID=1706855 RepID=UPI0036324220